MQKGNRDHYIYGGWWSVWWTRTYNMVPSKAAFFHKKYLSMYTNEMPASIREYTTKNRFFFFLLFFFILLSLLAQLSFKFVLLTWIMQLHDTCCIDFSSNCEAIAMSFLVANATSAPPIWVKGRVYIWY